MLSNYLHAKVRFSAYNTVWKLTYDYKQLFLEPITRFLVITFLIIKYKWLLVFIFKYKLISCLYNQVYIYYLYLQSIKNGYLILII